MVFRGITRLRVCLLARYNFYAKQKHPGCKKSEAKLEVPVSSYSSSIQLKSVISGGGHVPSSLASSNVRSLSEG